jgi:hypothetical protein
MFWLTAAAAMLCVLVPFVVREYREQQRRERMRAQREQTDKIYDMAPHQAVPLR